MGREDIDSWVNARMRTHSEGWASDTMDCILYGMENRAPYNWKNNPDTLEEYIHLIEVACEYIKSSNNFVSAIKLIRTLKEDIHELYRLSADRN